MIDKEILDAVLPLPTLDELKEQKVEELKDEGFVISNFHSGGVFYTMLMIVLRIKVEVIELLRVVLNNMFVSHAGGAWLDLKMADYSKKRKKAQKTQGFVTVALNNHLDALKGKATLYACGPDGMLRAVAKIADAVVVGSRIIEEIEQSTADDVCDRVRALVADLRRGIDAAGGQS